MSLQTNFEQLNVSTNSEQALSPTSSIKQTTMTSFVLKNKKILSERCLTQAGLTISHRPPPNI